jgi:hypothetical protein
MLPSPNCGDMHDAIHPHGTNVLALINNEDSFYRLPDVRYL